MEKSLPWVSKSHFITFYHLSQTSGTHPNLCLTPNSALPFPAVRAAPTGSLRERSTFSFHPLLEDKHQSHLAAHPYSWAAYKYLIAASLQLFSLGEQRKEPRTHTQACKQTLCLRRACAHAHTHTQAHLNLYCIVLSFAHVHARSGQKPDIIAASPSGSTCLATPIASAHCSAIAPRCSLSLSLIKV